LEQQTGVRRLQREIADFIDEEQFGSREIFDFAGQAILLQGPRHAARQVDGRSEVNAVSQLRGEHAQSDGQMRFADTGKTKKAAERLAGLRFPRTRLTLPSFLP
jgi:hypothetical protein